MLATDTQKNTVFAFARDGIGSPEAFGLRLARHFAGAYDWITGARIGIESYGWDRIPVGGSRTTTPSRGTAARCGRRWSPSTATTHTCSPG